MKELFGQQPQPFYLYTLENDALLLQVTDYGARCVALIDKRSGIDLLRGFDTGEQYVADRSHQGAVIGRVGNRIRNARFVLNGRTYQLPANEHGVTCLHSGRGLDQRFYAGTEGKDQVTFSYLSPDGEEGYPGSLQVTVTYTLKDNLVLLQVSGTADQDTLFGITCHNYWNLDDSTSILSHQVRIPAETYAPNDALCISLPALQTVAGTPFDFRNFHALGERIDAEDPQIQAVGGYDHHFPIPGSGLREFVCCKGEKLSLTMASDLPGMHLYTANNLQMTGRHGQQDGPHSAVCFEPEYFPNAINEPAVQPKPILRAHTRAVTTILWQVDAL